MNHHTNMTFLDLRQDLAAAFRWTARLGLHESVANHFSLAVNPEGTRFLINPNGRHFSRITASSLVEIDANDPRPCPARMRRTRPPGAFTAPSTAPAPMRPASCMSIRSTPPSWPALPTRRLPAIDQNTAMFHNRHVIDDHYGGMAFEEEGARCAQLLADPKITTMIMGNHGVLVIGRTVAETFNRLYYFERAAETYIRALQTGRPLRVLPEEIAEKTASEWEAYPGFAENHLRELRAILDAEDPGYANYPSRPRPASASRRPRPRAGRARHCPPAVPTGRRASAPSSRPPRPARRRRPERRPPCGFRTAWSPSPEPGTAASAPLRRHRARCPCRPSRAGSRTPPAAPGSAFPALPGRSSGCWSCGFAPRRSRQSRPGPVPPAMVS
jgi:ribulose-5-phosphate 4-epimerase/fuculose-1-phosphate aldolase